MSARRKGKPQQRKQDENLAKKDEHLHQQTSCWNGFDAASQFPTNAHLEHILKLFLEKMEPEQDLLTCGNCQREFPLSDITRFIQHKVSRCNKENIEPHDDHNHNDYDNRNDEEENDKDETSSVINSRRTSISAPIAHKAAASNEVTREKSSPHPSVTPDSMPDHLPENQHVVSSPVNKSIDTVQDEHKHGAASEDNAVINDRVTPESSISQVDGVKASDKACNTVSTEPDNLKCCSCKHSSPTAWSLLQHAQKKHGLRLYDDGKDTKQEESTLSKEDSAETDKKKYHVKDRDKHQASPNHFTSEKPLSLVKPSETPTPGSNSSRCNSTSSQPASVLPKTHPKSPVTQSPSSNSSDMYNQSPPFPVPRQMSPIAAFSHSPFSRPPFSPDFHEMLDPFRRFSPFGALPPGLEHTVPGFPFRPPGYDGSTSLADFYSKKLQQLAGQPNHFLAKQFHHFPTQPSVSHFSHPSNHNSPSQLTESAKSLHNSSRHKTCEFCQKKFQIQSNLILHRRQHTGEKPYKCFICQYSSPQASKLRHHLKTHPQAKAALSLVSTGFIPTSENSLRSNNSTPDSKSSHGFDTDAESENDNDIDEETLASREAKAEQDIKRVQERIKLVQLRQLENNDAEDEEEMDDDEDDVDEHENTNDSITNSSRKRKINSDETADDSKDLSLSKKKRAEIISEMMKDTGLSGIAEYKEAYSEALRESASRSNNISKEEDSKENINENGLLNAEPPRSSNRSSSVSLGSNKSSDNGQLESHDHKPIKVEPQDQLQPPHSNNLYSNLDLNPTRDIFHHSVWGIPHISMRNRELISGLTSNDHLLQGTHNSLHENGMHESALAASPKPHRFGISSSSPGSDHLPGVPLRRRNDTCEFCGKIFKNCSNLTVHRRSHTGEKPYKCELCNYACAQSSKLTRHMKTHGRVGMDVFRCKFCNMPFSVASTLEKHMRRCVEKHQREGGIGPMPALSPSSSIASSSTSNGEACQEKIQQDNQTLDTRVPEIGI